MARYSEAGLEMVPLSPQPDRTSFGTIGQGPPVMPAHPARGWRSPGRSGCRTNAVRWPKRCGPARAGCLRPNRPGQHQLAAQPARCGTWPFTPRGASLCHPACRRAGRPVHRRRENCPNSTREWLGRRRRVPPPPTPWRTGLARLTGPGRFPRRTARARPPPSRRALRAGGGPSWRPAGGPVPAAEGGEETRWSREGCARGPIAADAVGPSAASSGGCSRRRARRSCRRRRNLLAFRQAVPGFRGESFPAISGAGEHGRSPSTIASPRSPTARSDGTRSYLIDSGRAVRRTATTDVTRTVWDRPQGTPPAELRQALHPGAEGQTSPWRPTCFPPRVSRAPHLDRGRPGARCGEVGLDYDHGTGPRRWGSLPVGA